MRRRFVFGLLLIAAFFASTRAWAWNAVGHLASAKLAYDRLDARERIELFALLKTHPQYEMFLAAGRPKEVGEMEWALLRASVWSDWVRPRHNDARSPTVVWRHCGEEHYITIPFIDPKDEAAFANKTLVSPDQTDILCGLKHWCNILRIHTAAAEDKAMAICWIFHLVGDIHQPLHNASYFSSEPAFVRGDEGGNRFGVKINGRKWKLHAFWDDVLGEDANYADDSAEHQQAVFRDAMKVAARLRGMQFSAADAEKLAKHRSFASWSQESHDLATTVAYQANDGSGVLKHVEVKRGGAIPDDAPEAGAKYAETARAVAEVRVAMAGRRLAERIKELLHSDF